MNKSTNHKAWFLVIPVVLLVAFNALIPLMTVVNYSFQEKFGDNVFFWEGLRWYEQVLHSERFHASFLRQLAFTATILVIEVPLGIAVALSMPRKGPWVSVCLVLMALPLLIPWNVVGAMWNIFALPDIGLLGRSINALGIDYDFTQQPASAWATTVLMDVWHWTSLVVLLSYAGLCSIQDAYYQAARIDGPLASCQKTLIPWDRNEKSTPTCLTIMAILILTIIIMRHAIAQPHLILLCIQAECSGMVESKN